MKIDGCEFPDDLLYDSEGLVWARPSDSGDAVIGITSIHAAIAGRIAKVTAKSPGVALARGAAIGFLESGTYFGPIPVKLNELLTQVRVGEVVHLVTDDPTSPIEMVRWSDQTGQPVIDERREGNLFHFLVRKRS